MTTRYGSAAGFGALATLVLLFLMQALVVMQPGAATEYEVGYLNRAGVESGSDQTSDMGDVAHQQRSHFSRDLADTFEVDGPAVGAGTCHDHLWSSPGSCLGQFVVVEPLAVLVDPISLDLIELP